jgi:phytoene dehydrogenase-like protein
MPEQAEIIICGAGHNSLVTAAYLAQAGLDVLVLEKNELLGGGVTGGGRAPAIAMMTDMGMSLAEHFS